MNTRPHTSLLLSFPQACAFATLLTVPFTMAADYYWDTNDATAGAGGATPSGIWGSSGTNWSLSPNGTAAAPSYTTTTADDLFFSAGVNATGTYTINVADAQNAKSITFQDGNVTISGTGSVNLGGIGIINVPNSLAASPLTATIGNNTAAKITGSTGLAKFGVGTLNLNGSEVHTVTGGVQAIGGTLGLNFSNLATPTDLLSPVNPLRFDGGAVSITGHATLDSNQTFGDVIVDSGGSLLINPSALTFNLTLGSISASSPTSSLLIGKSAGSTGVANITTTSEKDATGTYGGRVVFANGTAGTGFDWATTTSTNPGPYALSAYADYVALDPNPGTDSSHSRVSASQVMSGSRTTNSLKFENPASAQTLDLGVGNTLTLESGGLLFSGASVGQGPRITNGSITVSDASGAYDLSVHQHNLTAQNIAIGITGTNMALVSTISSNIVNNGANPVTLVKNGPGGLVVSGTANTFSGGVVINGGNLAFNTATALNNNKITVNTNSTIHTFSGSTTTGDIELKNGSQLTILNNNSSFTVTGNVVGNGGMSAANGGQGAITLNLNGTGNTFTGPIRFTSNNPTQPGTINVGSLMDTNALGSGNIVFGAGTSSPTGNFFGVSAAAVAPVTLNNRQIEMAGDLVNHQITNASSQALTINPDLLILGTRAKNLTLAGGGTGLSTFAGAISNHPTPTAPGTVPVAVRTTAALTTAPITLTLASVEGILPGAEITGTGINAGTTITSINPFTRQVTLSANTTAAIPITTVFTIANVVNSVSVTKSGTSNWVLSGNNSYTGPTSLTAGSLNIQNVNALGATSTGTLVANAAALRLQGGLSYAAEPLTLTPGTGGAAMLLNVSGDNTWNGTITSDTTNALNVSRMQSDSGTLTLAGNITGSGSAHQLVFQGNGNITITGKITGAARVTSGASGTGVRTVSNDGNDFTGAINVNGSTLAFTSIGNIGAGPSALGAPAAPDSTIHMFPAAAPGALRYIGTEVSGHTSDRVINLGSTTGPLTIEASGAGPLVLTSALTTTGAGSKTLTLAGTNAGNNSIGAIVDNSATNITSLSKSGGGKWILSGVNTYTGATSVGSGTLALGVGGSITNSVSVAIAAGATLDTSAQANFAIPGAQPLTIDLNPAGAGTTGKIAAAGLDITNAAVTFNPAAALDDSVYVIATYTTLTGSVFASVTGLPSGYTLNYAYEGNKIALVSGGANYNSWASGNGIAGEPPTGDFDKDGMTNLLEYALGRNPAVADQPPGQLSGNTITFTKGAAAIANGDVAWLIETSETMIGSWTTAVTQPAGDPTPTISYTFTPGTPSRNFARLKVSLP